MRALESGLPALILVCTLTIWPSHGHAVSFEPLDEAAREFSLRISSAVSGHFSSTVSLHVVDLDSSVRDPGLVMAHKFIQQATAAELADSGRFHVLEGTSAALTADLLLRGSVTEVDGGLIVVVKLVDRIKQALVAGDERWISTVGLVTPPEKPQREATATGAASVAQAGIATQPGAIQPSPAPSQLSQHWLVLGGPGVRSRNIGWNVGVAYSPTSRRWEAALETGGYTHEDLVDLRVPSAVPSLTVRTTSDFKTSYVRARGEIVEEIRSMRPPRGEPVLDIPGLIKAGGGIGVYELKEKTVVDYGSALTFPSQDTRYRLRVAPMLDLSLARKIGPFLELQGSVEYIFESERFGVRDYTFGGFGYYLQLFCRL